MNWDFHCHSTESDGLLAPADVVRRAAGNGVERLALTDHDSTGGLREAMAAAATAGIDFVCGVEISIEWEQTPVHIVGLGIDRDESTLRHGLEELRNGRVERARRMAAELAEVGIAGAFEGAMRYAENPTLVSRSHFARFLVERGVCSDVRRVFEQYLVPGKPGYVDHRWASLGDAIDWIGAAGGVAVVAHPARYKFSDASPRRFLGEFCDRGGRGIEVVCASHTVEQVRQYAALAREFGLLASRGSDFHGPGESHLDLGRLADLPADLTPITTVV